MCLSVIKVSAGSTVCRGRSRSEATREGYNEESATQPRGLQRENYDELKECLTSRHNYDGEREASQREKLPNYEKKDSRNDSIYYTPLKEEGVLPEGRSEIAPKTSH